jgi:hypothetical protein
MVKFIIFPKKYAYFHEIKEDLVPQHEPFHAMERNPMLIPFMTVIILRRLFCKTILRRFSRV